MTFKLISEIVSVIIKTIEQTAVISVKSIKSHVFGVRVNNFPEVQKIFGEVSVDQSGIEQQLKKLSSEMSIVGAKVSSIKIPEKVAVSNFPKQKEMPKFPKFPDKIEIKGEPTVRVSGLREGNSSIIEAIRMLKLDPKIEVKVPEQKQQPIPAPIVEVKNEIDYSELSKELKKIIPKPELFDYKKFEKILEESVGSISFSSGAAASYKNSKGRAEAGLVDDDRHVQVDVLSSPPTPLPSEQLTSLIEASSQKNYTQRIDEASATVTYIGKAQIGSATSEAVWQIKKLDSTSGLVITWAGGTDAFTNEWDERAGYTYE